MIDRLARVETGIRRGGGYRFRIGFTDTFGDDFGVTFLVTGVFAVFTLISCCVFEEFATEGTSHDLIELLHYEFVAVDFVHFFFTLTDGSLTA